MRFSGLFNMSDVGTHIFGCGAIGSSAGMNLSRMGSGRIFLYDHDVVSEENVGVSEYKFQDVGLHKVIALEKKLTSVNHDVSIVPNIFKIEDDDTFDVTKNDIAVLAFDNMESRLNVAKSICDSKAKAIIDARMGAEQLQLYSISPPNLERYEQYWYSDEEGDPETCTTKSTSYCASLAGSFIANTIRKIVTKQPYNEALLFHFPTMAIMPISS